MKTIILIPFLVMMPVVFASSSSSDITTPQKRMVAVDLARSLLTTVQAEGGPDYIARNNPFDPVRRAADVAEEKPVAGNTTVTAVADRDLLANISSSINPSGSIQVGDRQILLFGQKKLKVGDSIQIVFQGTTYELQLIGLERTSYTLRLNKEEITRPIKTLNKP